MARWKTVGDDTRDRLIEECVEETMADYGNTIFQSSSRNQYRIIRVKRILKRTGVGAAAADSAGRI